MQNTLYTITGTVTLKKGAGRSLKAGGMWVYDNEISSMDENVQDGGLLTPGNLRLWKESLPDVDDPALYREGEQFVRQYKGEFALFCRIRLGFSPTLISIGQQACLDWLERDPGFVREVVSTYAGWMARHISNLMELGFDFLWSFDDLADKNGPFFTSAQLREVFLPELRRAASKCCPPPA